MWSHRLNGCTVQLICACLRAWLNPDWSCFLQINPSTDIFLGRPAAQILAVIASLDYGGRSVCALLLFSSSKTVQIVKVCSNNLAWKQGHPLGMGWQGFSNLASQGGFSFQMCVDVGRHLLWSFSLALMVGLVLGMYSTAMCCSSGPSACQFSHSLGSALFVWYREVQHENSQGLKGLQGIPVCTHENTLLLSGRATVIKTTNMVNVNQTLPCSLLNTHWWSCGDRQPKT